VYGFKRLISQGCLDIAQPDICCTGGISEYLRIRAFAQAFNVSVIPHAWGSGIALSVALQALASTPLEPHTANPVVCQNEPMIEYDRNFNPLRDQLLIQNIGIQNGKVLVPEGVGLGVDVNMETLEKYTAGA
jgi:D-galactarolactone cycloisomerase